MKNLHLYLLFSLFSLTSNAQKLHTKWSNLYFSIGKREAKYVSFMNPKEVNKSVLGEWSESDNLLRDAIYLNLSVGYRGKLNNIEIGRFGGNIFASGKGVVFDSLKIKGDGATVQELRYFYLSDFFHPINFTISNARIRIGVTGSILYGSYFTKDNLAYEGSLSIQGYLKDGKTIYTSTTEAKNIGNLSIKDNFLFFSSGLKSEVHLLKKFSLWGEFGYLHGFEKVGINYLGTLKLDYTDGTSDLKSISSFTNGSHFYFNIGISFYPFNKEKTAEMK